jgi:hypothetical protein
MRAGALVAPALVAAGLVVAPRGLAAQRGGTADPAVACAGQRIADVLFVARPPLFEAIVPRWVPWDEVLQRQLREAQGVLHQPSRPSALAPFLQLRPGDACDERRRAESERLLRALPYVAAARVTPVPAGTGDGAVLLVIETRDEVPLVFDARVRSRAPFVTRVITGNPNVLGEGARVTGGWLHGDGLRQGWFADASRPVVAGRPWRVGLEAARLPLGGRLGAELAQPFLTDYQRAAWSATLGDRVDYVPLQRPDTLPVAVRVERRVASLGGVLRIGPPGKLVLAGLNASYEREDPTGERLQLVPLGGVAPAGDTVLAGAYRPSRSARLNLLLGWRRLEFIRATGFDAVEGAQDLRSGLEVAGTLGRGLPSLGSDDADWFASIGVASGGGSVSRYGFVALRGEGRFVNGAHRWDALVASGRAQGFWRLTLAQTLVATLDGAAGGRSRSPFQLTAGDPEGGVRGFRNARLAGGARLVGRLEDRIYVGRVRDAAAFAIAPFVDVGRLWRGDVPYGATTPLLASAGIGVLGAVPPQSQVTWRADLAVRLTRDPYAAPVQLRFTVTDVGRAPWREPGDVSRSRPPAIPTSIFTWP